MQLVESAWREDLRQACEQLIGEGWWLQFCAGRRLQRDASNGIVHLSPGFAAQPHLAQLVSFILSGDRAGMPQSIGQVQIGSFSCRLQPKHELKLGSNVSHC